MKKLLKSRFAFLSFQLYYIVKEFSETITFKWTIEYSKIGKSHLHKIAMGGKISEFRKGWRDSVRDNIFEPGTDILLNGIISEPYVQI